MRILIVDDDPFLSKLLGIQLRSLRLRNRGYTEVVAFEHAQPAIDLLARADHDVGLLFCDLRMPEMDGVEFLRHIADAGYRGAVVLLSGAGPSTLRTARKLGLEYGLDLLAAIEKPVTPDRLEALLQERPTPGEAPSPEQPVDPALLATLVAEQQLVVEYQPVVAIASGAIVGFEALARLPGKDGTHILPAGFLDIAARDGLIDALDWQVLRKAVAERRLLEALSQDPFVSVNLAGPASLSSDYPDKLSGLLAAIGQPASGLRLEFSEATVFADGRSHLDVLARLSLLGVGLSLDRFGGGRTRLTDLGEAPFTEIKLDRSLVARHRAGAQLGLLAASVAIARELQFEATAVGVETIDDWRACRSAGCTRAQGHLIAAPMPASALERWAVSWPDRYAALPGD